VALPHLIAPFPVVAQFVPVYLISETKKPGCWYADPDFQWRSGTPVPSGAGLPACRARVQVIRIRQVIIRRENYKRRQTLPHEGTLSKGSRLALRIIGTEPGVGDCLGRATVHP
jgi:hypothetical protein